MFSFCPPLKKAFYGILGESVSMSVSVSVSVSKSCFSMSPSNHPLYVGDSNEFYTIAPTTARFSGVIRRDSMIMT